MLLTHANFPLSCCKEELLQYLPQVVRGPALSEGHINSGMRRELSFTLVVATLDGASIEWGLRSGFQGVQPCRGS